MNEDKFEAFVADLEQLCARHGVTLRVADETALLVDRLFPGDAPILRDQIIPPFYYRSGGAS